ncbi:MAG: YoaK family protein [Burkholderiales bacterium]
MSAGPARAGVAVDVASAVLLCAAAGMVDAVGFVRHGAFAANMTGNSVLMAIALAQRDLPRAVDCGAMLAWFYAGVLVGRLAWTFGRGRETAPLLLETLLLGACAMVVAERSLALGITALAMGVQGAALSRFAGVTLSTVVVTSTMVRIGEANADALVGRLRGNEPAGHAPLRLLGGSWLAYAAGAAAAVLMGPATPVPVVVAALLVALVTGLRHVHRP